MRNQYQAEVFNGTLGECSQRLAGANGMFEAINNNLKRILVLNIMSL